MLEDVYGEFGWEGRRLVGMGVAGDLTEDDRENAIALLQASLHRCRDEVAIHEIAKLRQMTKHRREAAADDAMLIDVLGDVLCEYPEDAVISACQQWRASNVFFPAEAELRKLLDAAVAERKFSLQAFKTAKPMPDPEPTRQRMQAKDVDAILAKVAKRSGKTVEEISRADPVVKPIPAESRPGLSQAQIEAAKAENQAAYWLKLMGAI